MEVIGSKVGNIINLRTWTNALCAKTLTEIHTRRVKLLCVQKLNFVGGNLILIVWWLVNELVETFQGTRICSKIKFSGEQSTTIISSGLKQRREVLLQHDKLNYIYTVLQSKPWWARYETGGNSWKYSSSTHLVRKWIVWGNLKRDEHAPSATQYAWLKIT